MRNPYRLQHYYTKEQKKRRSRRKRAVRRVKQGAEDTVLALAAVVLVGALAVAYFSNQ
jgi:hypothetical protein